MSNTMEIKCSRIKIAEKYEFHRIDPNQGTHIYIYIYICPAVRDKPEPEVAATVTTPTASVAGHPIKCNVLGVLPVAPSKAIVNTSAGSPFSPFSPVSHLTP